MEINSLNSSETSSDRVVSLNDDKPTADTQYTGLVGDIKEKFQLAKNERYVTEERWIRAYRNYRGVYGPEVQFKENEKSRVFVKITKTKVVAAYNQIMDVLLANKKIPIGVEPTIVPEGIEEEVHLKGQIEQTLDQAGEQAEDVYGYVGDDKPIEPGTTLSKLLAKVGLKPENAKLAEGPSFEPKSPQFSPADDAAKAAEKLIHDQLDENRFERILGRGVFQQVLLGHTVLKGPFNYKKLVNKWDVNEETGEMEFSPYERLMPKIDYVNILDFYPDPSATILDDCEWVIERHGLNSVQLRDLINRPYFRAEAIRRCLEHGPQYEKEWFEDQLDEEQHRDINKSRYEILEYWGVINAELAAEAGLDIDIDTLDQVQVNVWVCGEEIIRLVLNPFTPARLPYLSCPYEINPYNFFGIGVPDNMADSQQVMNGSARMAIDNLAISGNLVFDLDETFLVPGQTMDIYPGKIFRRQGGQNGQAVHGVKFPNTSNENMLLFDKFRQLADEQTGIPSYSHGQTGVSGTTRTASGMSMLFGASALNIKGVITNIDEYILRPLGESLYSWNMQFNSTNLDIRGDLEIRARGTAALMQKEIRSQRLLTFLQISANPAFLPFIKWPVLLEEIAKSLDIDSDKILNSPEEAEFYAYIIGMVQQNAQKGSGQVSPTGEQQGSMGGTNGVPTGANPNDPTGRGGGNIGTGTAAMPGEADFSGNT